MINKMLISIIKTLNVTTGYIIGIMTAIMVNILTNQSSNLYHWLASIVLVVATITGIKMAKMTADIFLLVSIRQERNPDKSIDDLLMNSINDNEKKKKRYIWILAVTIILSICAIVMNLIGNNIANKASEENITNTKLEINQKMDSLKKIITENSFK